MSSANKKSKTDKRKHWGTAGNFLKFKGKLKRVAFYNSSQRKKSHRDDILLTVDFNLRKPTNS
jgi:hypothetical protein